MCFLHVLNVLVLGAPCRHYKISPTCDMNKILKDVIWGGYPMLIVVEDIEQDVFATLVVNKLCGVLKVANNQSSKVWRVEKPILG